MQSLLSACKINITSKSCLEKELAYKSGSTSLARVFLSEKKVSCFVTKRRAESLKRDFFMNWTGQTLSDLQLLNLVKICVGMFSENKNVCTFFASNDPELDRQIVKAYYYVEGGLKLEESLMNELLVCLPFDNSSNSDFILNNPNIVWGHFCFTLFNNYPPICGEPRKISIEEILSAFVCVVQGLGAGFSPSTTFKEFVLDNTNHKDFLANASEGYIRNLLGFYQTNMGEDAYRWFVGSHSGTPRTRFSYALTNQNRTNIFNSIKV